MEMESRRVVGDAVSPLPPRVHRAGAIFFFPRFLPRIHSGDAMNNLRLAHMLLTVSFAFLTCGVLSTRAEADDAQGIEFFEERIRPVLVQHCYECHSVEADEAEGGLLLDTRGAIRQGGESGHAVVPGDVENSVLMDAIEFETFEMPPEGKLSDKVIADFRKWIEMGAPDPRDGTMTMPKPGEPVPAERLWSVQPLTPSAPPVVQDADWPTGSVDQYVLDRLESEGLTPVADAEPLKLLRRVYFDLIGLPPPPEAIREFQADPSPAAYASVVDRLLSSPQFGERWARHWLDVVRFAESNGKDRDVLMPHAWRYRNYVIDAINDDIPYGRFITEQIAGDLLEADTANERDRLRVATGLLAIGAKSLTGNLEMDLVDDQIDVVTRSFLGLTASCARCHDHKFDPIPTSDYYALAGIFRSTDTLYGGGLRAPKDLAGKTNVLLVLGENSDDQVAQVQAWQKQIDALEKRQKALSKRVNDLKKKLPKNWRQRLKALRSAAQSDAGTAGSADDMPQQQDAEATGAEPPKKNGANTDSTQNQNSKKGQKAQSEDELVLEFAEQQEQLDSLEAELKALKAQNFDLAFAVGVRDDKKIADCKIHIRGEKNRLGDEVPRGYLSCIQLPEAPEISDEQSGRLQLARWIADPQNPLTSRVAVNRVWLHLFGRGLVETVDNFGATGARPTHPELLDHLALRFVTPEGDVTERTSGQPGFGGSLKQLVRELVLSHTYQLSAKHVPANYTADPGNELFWRMSRKRLEAEAIRDAMLAASGELRLERPEGSLVARIGDGEVGRGINTSVLSKPFPYRSVYLPIIRGLLPEVLKTFDFPEPSNIQGRRDVTNVPAQSLYLMNSPFVVRQAEAFARRLMSAHDDVRARITLAFLLSFSRPPAPEEVELMQQFLERTRAAYTASGMDDNDAELAEWTSLCQSLLASAEFRFLE